MENVSKISSELRKLGQAAAPAARRLPSALTTLLLSAIPAQNLVVLKTPPGHAGALAAALDREKPEGVLASLAGDDTILLITPDVATATHVASALLPMARSTP